MARVFLVNVGVNAGHSIRSPRFADGGFWLLPIPERVPAGGPPMVRYGDLTFTLDRGNPQAFIPSIHRNRYCHYDPEFVTFTYGDDPRRAPRAAALASARTGDLLLFIARLWDWQAGSFTGGTSFYLAAILQIESALKDVAGPLSPEEMAIYGANAHVRRAQADPNYWNGFWVFKGTKASHLFQRAFELTPERAAAFLRDKDGHPWVWRADRTPLQTIGSYTRTVRGVADTTDQSLRAWPEELLDELPV